MSKWVALGAVADDCCCCNGGLRRASDPAVSKKSGQSSRPGASGVITPKSTELQQRLPARALNVCVTGAPSPVLPSGHEDDDLRHGDE